VKRGVCQLGLNAFRDVYQMLSRHIKLLLLSEEPEIIEYPDETFALNWWPHLIYNVNGDQNPTDTSSTRREKSAMFYHQNYLQNDLRYLNDIVQGLQSAFQPAQVPQAVNPQFEADYQRLQEENNQLKAQIRKVTTDLQNATAKATRLEEETHTTLEDTHRALEQSNRKQEQTQRELEEQKKLVKQLQEEIAKLKAPVPIKPAIVKE